MQRKRLIFISFSGALIILLLCGFFSWFYAPGLHQIGPFMNVDISEDCVRQDDQNAQPQSVHIKGFISLWDRSFKGIIAIEGVDSNSGKQGTFEHYVHEHEDGTYSIQYNDNYFTVQNGELTASFDGYVFDVMLNHDGLVSLTVSIREENHIEQQYTLVIDDN